MRGPDGLDLHRQQQELAEQRQQDLEHELFKQFSAGRFKADFLPRALRILGTNSDHKKCEYADKDAHDLMVDLGCYDEQIFTHFLIHSQMFRELIFLDIREEYADYVGVR